MESAGLARLDHLTRLELRDGVDMRPTLLRVLTDLYVQKPTHTSDEERHYTELALRLLDAVDVGTRQAVAESLARYGAPPLRVIERLGCDLPDVAAAVRRQATAQKSGPIAPSDGPIQAGVADELNELFLAANPRERRLILLNLAFESFRRVLLQIHVRVGVIPHRLRRRPQLQRLGTVGTAFELLCIDESVHRRHMPLLQNLHHIPGRLGLRHSRRQLSIPRQIVKRDGQLLRGADATQHKQESPGRQAKTKPCRLPAESAN